MTFNNKQQFIKEKYKAHERLLDAYANFVSGKTGANKAVVLEHLNESLDEALLKQENAMLLAEIAFLMGGDPDKDSREGKRLRKLAKRCEEVESKLYPR